MNIQSLQSSNQTNFGTRFGPKLTKFLEQNKESLSNENFRIISTIRNNGINSVLELEDASFKEKKLFKYKYKLCIRGPKIDKKNYIMFWKDTLYTCFQDYIKGTVSGKPIATNNRFPVPINDLKENTFISVIQKFNDKFGLADKIEEEIKQSNIILREFNIFKQNWMDKLSTNK